MAKMSITLRVQADDLDPDQITELLGLTPTATFRKGDQLSKHGRAATKKRRFGHWAHTIEIADTSTFGATVRDLLQRTPNACAPMDETSKITIDLFVGVFGVVDQSSFELDADVLSELGRRGIPVFFDLYN